MKKRSNNAKLYPVRLQLLITAEQYRKLVAMAETQKISMGAVLRSLLDDSK